MSKFNIGDFVRHGVVENVNGIDIIDGLGCGEVVAVVNEKKDIYEVLFPVEDSVERADMVFKVNGSLLSLVAKPSSVKLSLLEQAKLRSDARDIWPDKLDPEFMDGDAYICEVHLDSMLGDLVLTKLWIIPEEGTKFHVDLEFNGLIKLRFTPGLFQGDYSPLAVMKIKKAISILV